MPVDFEFSGKDYAVESRDGYLDNIDNSTRESISIDLEMTAIPVILGICFLVGIVGNGALLYTISKAKKFRNVPNSFLLNITIANIAMLIICPPMIATSYVLGKKWPFGSVACKMVYSIPQAALAVSMFSLIGLSIERYGAFAAPPRHRTTAKTRACIGNIAIWILGAACGLPLAIFSAEDSHFEIGEDGEEEKTIMCRAFNLGVWKLLYPKIHAIVSICFLFLIPILLSTIFYLSLCCVVCGKKQREGRVLEDDSTPLKNGTRSSRSGTLTKTTSSNTKTNTIQTLDSRVSLRAAPKPVRKRRTMAKVALFLMTQFTVLWAPQWAYTLRYYYSYEEETMLWYLISLIGLVCVYINAALTPFTVVICNRTFRHQLGKYLCCCFSCLSCCICLAKKEKVESPLPSTSDVSDKSPPKRRCACCVCCCPSHDDSTESDSESESSRDVPDDAIPSFHDQSNVYQELPGQPTYYDSYTLPINRFPANSLHSSPNKSLTYNPSDSYNRVYAPSDQPAYRSSYNEGPRYASSYHGDNQMGPYDRSSYSHNPNPYGPSRNPRYTSDPLLHAQAPKYSKIFMPQRPPQLEQVTSIRELPAM